MYVGWMDKRTLDLRKEIRELKPSKHIRTLEAKNCKHTHNIKNNRTTAWKSQNNVICNSVNFLTECMGMK